MNWPKKTLFTSAIALGLAACAPTSGSDVPASGRLADLEVNDPNFTFATQRTVRLEVKVADAAAPQKIEVSDAEGRRLMEGAFLQDARLDLKVPVGAAQVFNVRTGQGAAVTEQAVQIDASGHAVTTIR